MVCLRAVNSTIVAALGRVVLTLLRFPETSNEEGVEPREIEDARRGAADRVATRA